MKPTPVAIYARYSTDRQDARSIEDSLRAHLQGFPGVSFAVRGFLAERIEAERSLAELVRSFLAVVQATTRTNYSLDKPYLSFKLDPKRVSNAIELSATKYCSASIMLGKTAEITHDFEILED